MGRGPWDASGVVHGRANTLLRNGELDVGANFSSRYIRTSFSNKRLNLWPGRRQDYNDGYLPVRDLLLILEILIGRQEYVLARFLDLPKERPFLS